MSINIVTGYTGTPHVTAQQDRFINQGAFDNGTCVLPVGNQFECTITGATQISVKDGALSLQGCVGVQDPGTVWTGTVENGETGMNRIDYLCVRYEKTAGGVESLAYVIKKGTAVAGTPTPPSYTYGLIESGATVAESPLWQLNISGLSITSVERTAPVVQTQYQLMVSIAGFNNLISGKANTYTFGSGYDLNVARGNMAIREVFLFCGTGTYSQDVLGLDAQANAFGIGWKNSTTSVVLLSVCGGKLYYSTYTNTGAGSVYNPLTLTSNEG